MLTANSAGMQCVCVCVSYLRFQPLKWIRYLGIRFPFSSFPTTISTTCKTQSVSGSGSRYNPQHSSLFPAGATAIQNTALSQWRHRAPSAKRASDAAFTRTPHSPFTNYETQSRAELFRDQAGAWSRHRRIFLTYPYSIKRWQCTFLKSKEESVFIPASII